MAVRVVASSNIRAINTEVILKPIKPNLVGQLKLKKMERARAAAVKRSN